jgi:Asp-tRNA(Asn)/Glu-tRNA(Gln) amidotransferase A subunit family amidase
MGLFPSEHETIEGVGRALRAGETTCVAVLEKCLDRIEEWEPRVKAWVRVDRDGALEQARALDAELADGGDRGPLHGIPIGIKDIIDVQGLPTACGFRPWSDRVAAEDAPLVANLRTAGAVIMGKTVTTQFAWIDPPPTRNPWNLDRTPGGSSSGSAAAVALGMCLGAIGTQTGGSITRPASFCGICGLKPSFGMVSTEGIMPFAPSLDHPGVMTRTVRDLELVYDVISRFGWTDAVFDDDLVLDDADPVLKRAFAEPAQSPSPSPTLRRLRGVFEDQAEPMMRQAFEEAISVLSAAGAWVRDLSLPEEFNDVHRSHRVLMACEAAAGHEKRLSDHPDDYQPRIRALIEEGLATMAVEYVRCAEDRERLRVALSAGFDGDEVLISPATMGAAPDLSTTGDPLFNSPWSYTGLPTISLPFTLSAEGLPLAVQLIGDFDKGEEHLFRVALWCERVFRSAFRARQR